MNRDAREAARIIGRIQANVLGILGEVVAHPEIRRRLLHTAARGPARQKLKRQLAAFERLVETARRQNRQERKGKVSQCPL